MPHNNSGSVPHYSSVNAYRPAVNYRNGNRTLSYPPVGNSVLRQRMHSNADGLNSGYALQHTGNFHQADSLHERGGLREAANLHHTEGLRQTGHLHGAGNSNQHSGLDAIGKNKLDPQASNRLRHWNGNRDSIAQARLNHADHCHRHHGRNWWRNHCAAIIFFNWGWWGWSDGWWYPAWGYDPYSYYEYNEPISGYDGLSPDQIVASVQTQLQQLGYYSYEIDGQMGPLTRAAIARYQRDNLLPITSGIDPATLGSLGITR